jgi:hypothetical protein
MDVERITEEFNEAKNALKKKRSRTGAVKFVKPKFNIGGLNSDLISQFFLKDPAELRNATAIIINSIVAYSKRSKMKDLVSRLRKARIIARTFRQHVAQRQQKIQKLVAHWSKMELRTANFMKATTGSGGSSKKKEDQIGVHSYGVDETKQNPIWVVIGRPVTKANKMRILGVLYQQRQQQFCHDWQEWRKRCQRLGINLKARVKHKHKVAGPGNPLISWLQIAAEHPTRPLEETKLLAEEPRLVVDQTLLMVDPMTRTYWLQTISEHREEIKRNLQADSVPNGKQPIQVPDAPIPPEPSVEDYLKSCKAHLEQKGPSVKDALMKVRLQTYSKAANRFFESRATSTEEFTVEKAVDMKLKRLKTSPKGSPRSGLSILDVPTFPASRAAPEPRPPSEPSPIHSGRITGRKVRGGGIWIAENAQIDTRNHQPKAPLHFEAQSLPPIFATLMEQSNPGSPDLFARPGSGRTTSAGKSRGRHGSLQEIASLL